VIKPKKIPYVAIILIVFSFIPLLPLIMVVLTSFKPEKEILSFSTLFPQNWTLHNFTFILSNKEEIPIFRWLFNSIFVAIATTFFVLFINSLAAFALARLKLPFKKIAFTMIIATLMIPGVVTFVPLYLVLNYLKWIDSYKALIIPGGASAFGVFLLYQFFKGIPRDYDESAMIDGASKIRIYFSIILPMSKPVLSTLGIFTFMGSWNSFLYPLIVIDSNDLYTLPVGLALFQGTYTEEYGLAFALSLMSSIPILIIFLIFQKAIIKGMALTGIK